MKIKRFKKIVLVSFLLLANYNFSQNPLLSNKAKASILTCGTGNESYSLFGHTAIRIYDIENNIDVVYNYGAFDFNTPNFVAKFAKGDLQYFAITHSYEDFIFQYNYEKRAVYEQHLNINTHIVQKLYDNLNNSLASGESHYTYKFIDRNCTTMVIDIINKTLGKQIIKQSHNKSKTYRSILYPYFNNHFYEKLGISIVFGTKVDQEANHIFLPYDLMGNLKQNTFNGKPFINSTRTVLQFANFSENSLWNNCFTYLFFFGLILIINKKTITIFYFIMMGVLGLFFTFLGFYSGHHELANNYNVLVFNPSLILLVLFSIKNNSRWIYNIAVFNIICLFAYLIILHNKVHYLIVVPIIITNGVLLFKLAIKHKKKTPIII